MLENVDRLGVGSRLKLRHIKELSGAIRSSRVRAGYGIDVTQTGGGCAVSLSKTVRGAKRRGFECISLYSEKETWYAKLAPGIVGRDGGKFVVPKVKGEDKKELPMDDENVNVYAVEEKLIFLGVKLKKKVVDSALISQKVDELAEYDIVLALGKFINENGVYRYEEYRSGPIILDGEVCPFMVVWEAPEAAAGGGGDAGSAGGGGSTPPAGGGGAEGDGGAPPKFKIKLNDGMVAALGDGFTSPFEGSIATLPTGMYGTREIKVDEAGYTGRYAVLKADIAYDGKIKLSFEGSEEDVKIAECDASGKPTCSRVVLSVYEEGQRVRSNLFLSPLYIGGGLHYFFTPFV